MDKAFIKNPVEAYEKLQEEIKQLKAENEKLKAKIIEWLGKEGVTATQKEIYEKYKQTLKEIKEIALKSDMLPCGNINRVCSKCNDEITKKGKRCMEYGLNKILQKINECEVIDEKI
jgi:hypothetical protein